MKEDKNIENKIREKLENFQPVPPPHIWDGVQGKLAAGKHKRRMIYISSVSAAAVVVLAFLAGWYFSNSTNFNENTRVTSQIVQPGKTRIENKELPQEFANKDVENEKITKNSGSAKRSLSDESTRKSISTAALNAPEKESYTSREKISINLMKSAVARITENQHAETGLAQTTKTGSENNLTGQEQLLIAENIKNLKSASKPENNWKMGMYVAPGYSSYSASHSESYSKQMTYSGNSGNANVGGGVSVQYKTSKRWIVESGVYYAQSGQESESSLNIFAQNKNQDYSFAPSSDKSYFSNIVQVENSNMVMNSTAGVIQFNNTPKGAELSGNFDASNSGFTNLLVPSGQFSQVFQFVEIPLYARYRVVDSKFGVELITGLNTGIVVGNDAYISNQYGVQNIGETLDISSVNIAGTLGVGLNYELGKNFAVALEPRFLYYLNSINSNPSVEFRPYRIGIYTGLVYAF